MKNAINQKKSNDEHYRLKPQACIDLKRLDTLQKDTGFIVEPKIRRKKNYIKFSKVGPKILIGANHKDQICNSLQNNDNLFTSSSFIKSIILIKLYQHGYRKPKT